MAVITIPGMFLTGDHASRPAANTVGSGSIYSCTTHALIYQSDGSSWTTWATLGVGDATTHIADASDAHDASAISFDPTGLSEVTGTDVQTAIEELDAASGGGGAADLDSARYVRSSGNYTITGAGSTTFANVDGTNLNLALTTGARRALIVLQAVGVVDNAAGAISLDVELDGGRVGGATGGLLTVSAAAANELMNLSFVYVTDTLSAAAHTFELMWLQANAAHNATLRGSDPPLSFAVVELYA